MNFFLFFGVLSLQGVIRQWFFSQLLKAKYHLAWAYLSACIVGASVYLFIGWVLQPYVSVDLTVIRGIGVLIIEMLLLFLFYEGKWRYKVFLYLCCWVIAQVSDMIAWALAKYYLGLQMEPSVFPNQQVIAGYLIYDAVAFALTAIGILFFKKKKFLFKKITLLYFCYPIIQMLIVFLIFSTFAPAIISERHMNIILLLSGMMIACGLVVIQSFDSFSQKEFLSAKLNAMEELQKNEYFFYRQAQEHVNEMSVIRHDFNDQLQTIRYLVLEDTPESTRQAKKLIDEVHERLTQTRRMRYCENEVANAVFCVNAEKFEAKRIELTIHADIPQELSVQPVDLCGVLSNLISNAYQACLTLENGRFVSVTVKQKNEYLHIRVVNNCQRHLSMAKKISGDQSAHGYGMLIINSIVERYDGSFEKRLENGIFIADVLLRIEVEPALQQ